MNFDGMLKLSVIICTHNPRIGFLQRVIEALRTQTLDTAVWELIVVDNASEMSVESSIDLDWHPRARVIIEAELGLTPARLRGIAEASGEILVFVDDDNVLQRDYLQHLVRILDEWPQLGAIGAGHFKGVFEEEPADEVKPHLAWLVIGEVERDMWGNQFDFRWCPPGAGLAVRAKAARIYAEIIKTDPVRKALDRRGTVLTSAGDGDLVWTALEHGWGAGRFTCLKLDHLISAARVRRDYLERLIQGQWYSKLVLKYIHGNREDFVTERALQRLGRWRYERTLTDQTRWAYDAERRGRSEAFQLVKSLNPEKERT